VAIRIQTTTDLQTLVARNTNNGEKIVYKDQTETVKKGNEMKRGESD